MTASSCFVTNAEGQVLLVRSLDRSWECPGGKVDPGESPLDALHREVFEETGCRVEVDGLVGIYVSRTDGGFVILSFRGTWLEGDPRPSEETPEVRWFSPEHARVSVPEGPHGLRLEDAMRMVARPVYREYTTDPFEVVVARDL